MLVGLFGEIEVADATRSSSEPSCTPLRGIEPGGRTEDGKLDWDKVSLSVAHDPFDLFNVPIIPVVAGCSSGLETPPNMRALLCE